MKKLLLILTCALVSASFAKAQYCATTTTLQKDQFFLTDFSTTGADTDVSFTGESYPTDGYRYDAAERIVMSPGQQVDFKFSIASVWGGTSEESHSRVIAWIDYNGDESFDANEQLFHIGNPSSDNYTVLQDAGTVLTVPANVTLGVSRLRLQQYDSWSQTPNGCGSHNSTTYDFEIEFVEGSGTGPQYCTTTTTLQPNQFYLTDFSTTGASTDLSFTGEAYPTNGYRYDMAESIVMNPDQQVDFKFSIASVWGDNSNTSHSRVIAWIDYNGDKSFDASEQLFHMGNINSDNYAALQNVGTVLTVPANVTLGASRLRLQQYDSWSEAPDGCGSHNSTTYDFDIEFTTATALNDQTEDFIKIYPTMVNDEFTVECDKTSSFKVMVFNSVGGLVKTSQAKRVNVSDLNRGMYFVKVMSNNHVLTKKIIINR